MRPSSFTKETIVRPLLLPFAAAALLAGAAQAAPAAPASPADQWATECGSCHVPYPARFLPATTWTRLMSGLDKHFGANASLDSQTAKTIADYLGANAAGRKRTEDPTTMRISDTRWFRHEHSEDLDPAVFKSPQVKSAANCEACHLGAAKGDFSEHNVRIPGQGARRHED
jgi:hypothetical protein